MSAIMFERNIRWFLLWILEFLPIVIPACVILVGIIYKLRHIKINEDAEYFHIFLIVGGIGLVLGFIVFVFFWNNFIKRFF